MIYIQTFAIPDACTGKVKHETEHQAGLALLEKGLEREYGLEIREISSGIQKGKNGKPYLKDFPEIHFNISHSGNVAACVLGAKPLGIDVEVIRQAREPVIRRVLAKKEQDYLAQVPKEIRDREFFRFWTLKESYGKALGLGLSLDFTAVEFELPVPVYISRKEAGETAGEMKGLKNEINGLKSEIQGSARGASEEIRFQLLHAAAGEKESWQFFQWIWREGKEEWVVSLCGQDFSGCPQVCFCGQ